VGKGINRRAPDKAPGVARHYKTDNLNFKLNVSLRYPLSAQ
jgi:hypothetical protein